MTERPTASASRETLADLVTLALTLPLVVSARPDLSYLSLVSRGGELGGDTLGAAAQSVGMLLWLGMLGATLWRLAGAGERTSSVPTMPTMLRWTLLGGLGLLFFVLPSLSDQGALAAFGPGGSESLHIRVQAHDGGVLQTEAATRALLDGENPYAADYAGTPMAASHHSRPALWRAMGFEKNPAFGFFPYPPLSVALPLPLRAVVTATGRVWDPRLFHLLAWGGLAWLCARGPRDPALAGPLVAAVALSPVAAGPFAAGYNDVLCLAASMLTLWFASRGRHPLAFVALAVACGLKQFAWLAVPLYVAHRFAALREGDGEGQGDGAPGALLRELAPGLGVLALTILPFLLWNPGRLWFCLISAQGALYPVRATGLGVSNLLVAWGWVSSPRDPTPNALLYAVLVLPTLAASAYALWRRANLATLAGGWALTTGVFLFASRHFAPSYAWFVLALVAATAWLALDTDAPHGVAGDRDRE